MGKEKKTLTMSDCIEEDCELLTESTNSLSGGLFSNFSSILSGIPCHERDLHVLSISFILIFMSFGAIQNLESSVNKVRFN